MSFGKRLLNIARAELRDAAKRVKDSADDMLGGGSSERSYADPLLNEDPDPGRSEPDESPEIRRYYANLELPIGASKDEVKAAYRRLMRRYHPDRHHKDPAREEAATKLATELRTAYEGLMAHLGD